MDQMFVLMVGFAVGILGILKYLHIALPENGGDQWQ